MHPDGAIYFFDIKTKRQMVRVDIYVFMSLCLMFGGIVATFFLHKGEKTDCWGCIVLVLSGYGGSLEGLR
ncbi:MAG: hypothetical protein K2M54_06180, partial [Muribaculaceae bacterium]|nr:hypothetical protein [Muribaculaceae bacterium]